MEKAAVLTTDEEIDDCLNEALEYARTHPPLPAVRAVEYLSEVRLLLMHMKDGSRVAVPVEDVEELAFATDEQLQHFEIEGGGGLVHFPNFDGNLDVPFIATGGRGGPRWMEQLEAWRTAALREAA